MKRSPLLHIAGIRKAMSVKQPCTAYRRVPNAPPPGKLTESPYPHGQGRKAPPRQDYIYKERKEESIEKKYDPSIRKGFLPYVTPETAANHPLAYCFGSASLPSCLRSAGGCNGKTSSEEESSPKKESSGSSVRGKSRSSIRSLYTR